MGRVPDVKRLLIANRGEVVARIARTARRLGIGTAGVYSDADRGSPVLRQVDVALRLPGVATADTYLAAERIVDAARRAGADAVHPGYGFLAESADFAAAVIDAGLVWVGPDPEDLRRMGDKVEALATARAAGVPVLPSGPVDAAAEVGFPLVVKAVAGGGGRGMRTVHHPDGLADAVAQASGEARRAFGDGTVYVERLVSPARHIEVQVVGDARGNLVHLYERECSVQRRHQKVIEEAPSPGIDPATREALCAAAVRLASGLGYRGAGTVEFLVDDDGYWFIEMNTRLQVEHPVTEEITGIDLVEWQLRVARGEPLPADQDAIAVTGHAVEARIYAEDPQRGWAPTTGTILRYAPGGDARYEDDIAEGWEVGPHYDSMLAKVIAHRPTREEAAAVLAAELSALVLHGPRTNRDFLVAALRSRPFLDGETYTTFVDEHPDLAADPDPATVDLHLAAALLARVAANRGADPHWGFAPAGWRNVPSQWSRVGLGDCRVEYRVDGDTLRFRVDAGAERVAAAAGDLVEVDGIAARCRAVRHGATWWVNSPRGQSAFVEADPFPSRDVALAGGGPTAPMPGTVIEVLVAAGDRVEAGRDLLVMEAMKMEHRVRAPAAAVVAAVLVAPGDRVEAGQPLVRLEEPT
jgi:propionyl-CoA carboxylase alpha chain